MLTSFCIAQLAHGNTVSGANTKPAAKNEVHFSAQERALVKLHGPWPASVPPDPGNEYSGLRWAEAAGKQLFNDPGLSGNQRISCATCHQQARGFTDGQPVAHGSEIHFRNTQTLLNVGLQRWFGWDGGADSLWAAALRPMLSDKEMAGSIRGIAQYLRETPTYQAGLQVQADGGFIALQALSDESIAVKATKLIASYVRTIESGVTPFDQFRQALIQDRSFDTSVFTPSARRGLKLFLGQANCRVCHYGANFSNGEFHDIGRPFFIGVGRVDPGRYRGLEYLRADPFNLAGKFNGTNNRSEVRKTNRVKQSRSDWGRWRTPSLRNLLHTGPYMHDGSLATLRDVVDAYADIDPSRLHTEGESILKPLDLSDQQREDLVAFLQSLSIVSE